MEPVRHWTLGVIVAALAGIALSCATANLAEARQICFGDCSPLTYHGGPVMHGERTHLVFWEPPGYSIPDGLEAGVQKAVDDIGADSHTLGNVFAVAGEYYDLSGPGGARSFVPYAVSGAGSIEVHDPLPAKTCTGTTLAACVTDTQVRAELAHVVQSRDLPTGLDTAYVVLLPQGVGSCYDAVNLGGEPLSGCAYTGYCAYHSFVPTAHSQIVYAVLPWQSGTRCDAEKTFDLGYPHTSQADPTVVPLVHELIEAMTDPDLNAWYDDQREEIADKCAQIWGPGGRYSTDGLLNNGLGDYNQLFDGEPYLVTWEFSTRELTCTDRASVTPPGGSSTTTPPPAPVTPAAPATVVTVRPRVRATTLAGRRLRVTLRNPGTAAMSGSIALKWTRLKLGRARFSVEPLANRRVTVKLSRAGLRLIHRHRRLRLRMEIVTQAAGAAPVTTVVTLVTTAPRRRARQVVSGQASP